MGKHREVYLLDPYLECLFVLDVEDLITAAEIKNLIGSDSVDVIGFDSDHLIYFDDEGLRSGINHYTMLQGHPDPLVGKLLISHRDLTRSVVFISPLEFLDQLTCYKPVIDPVIESIETKEGRLTTYISAVTGFQTRIQATAFVIRHLDITT